MVGTAGVTEIRRGMRWALRHGLVRQTVMPRIRAGELGSRVMMDDELLPDPFAAYERLRAEGRLVDAGMALITTDHALCTAVLRSPDFGTVPTEARLSRLVRLAIRAGGRGPLGPVEAPSMLAVDPPDHTRYRKLVTRAFSARAVAALRTRAEEIAEELLDEMAGRGPRADLVEDYANLLPATVIAEMLGAPVSMRRQFLMWGEGAALSLDVGLRYREFRRAERDLAALQEWMLGHFESVRRSPGEDILSALVTAHDQGTGLSEDELTSIAMLLLAAGFETTVNLIGNGVGLLARHPEQLALLRAEPQRWPNAVEEMLRFDSPVQRTARIARRDIEVDGERLREGQLVVLVIGAANRDPAVFADPDRFDVTRADAGAHLAFSSGIHYCLGAGLARMEAEVGLRALFRRFPELELTRQPQRRPTRVLRGYAAMPVTLGAPATLRA
jgi:cytochrome P450